ncbi:MAG: RNA 2',3'-cyclic phosphodiesterase [Elusimicrobiota bacterium]
MRLFIASGFSAPVLAKITDLQEFARPLLVNSVKWVEPKNIHLTYAFLGDVPQASLPAIMKVIDEAAGAFRRIRVTLGGFGAFPSFERPRVLWLGLKEGDDALKDISGKLCAGLTAEGFVFEHEFSAHITIARVNSTRLAQDAKIRVLPETGNSSSRSQKSGLKVGLDRAALASVAERAEKLNAADVVASLDLIESMLASTGPRYQTLYHKELI